MDFYSNTLGYTFFRLTWTYGINRQWFCIRHDCIKPVTSLLPVVVGTAECQMSYFNDFTYTSF